MSGKRRPASDVPRVDLPLRKYAELLRSGKVPPELQMLGVTAQVRTGPGGMSRDPMQPEFEWLPAPPDQTPDDEDVEIPPTLLRDVQDLLREMPDLEDVGGFGGDINVSLKAPKEGSPYYGMCKGSYATKLVRMNWDRLCIVVHNDVRAILGIGGPVMLFQVTQYAARNLELCTQFLQAAHCMVITRQELTEEELRFINLISQAVLAVIDE